MNALLLVTDARWPIDADGGRVGGDLQRSQGLVTALRVPDGPALYGRVPHRADDLVVVVAPAGAEPVSPPASWLNPVCWHVDGGCQRVWNAPVASTGTIVEFAVVGRPSPAQGGPVAFAMAVIAVGLLTCAVGMLARVRRHLAKAAKRSVETPS